MNDDSNQRIGLFGGTFNPIHLGHLLMAQDIVEQLGLDRLILIPNGLPPHRATPGVSDVDRLEMVRLACRAHPAFEATDVEIEKGSRGEVSYSYQTVDIMRDRFPQAELFFVTGVDSILQYIWKNFDHLLSQVQGFVVAARPGFERRLLIEKLEKENLTNLDRLMHLESRQIQLSSSEIRQRLAEGRSCSLMLTEAVWNWIENKGLYR